MPFAKNFLESLINSNPTQFDICAPEDASLLHCDKLLGKKTIWDILDSIPSMGLSRNLSKTSILVKGLCATEEIDSVAVHHFTVAKTGLIMRVQFFQH